jgi:hypothetical protein
MTEPVASIVSPLESQAGSRFDRLVAKYRHDHRHPVNHILHVWIGWPIMALAVVLVPFRPFWSLGLFFTSYGIMWAGHFLFEGNLPTIFQHPTTPFVIAWSVIRDLGRRFARLVGLARDR